MSRRLGAVVVNYEAGDALVSCVASLRRAGIEEIVVVDNGSRDGSPAALFDADPAVRLLPLGRNLGYGSAANRGVDALSKAVELVLVCNPDLEVDPAAPAALAAELDRHRDAAVAGPGIESPAGDPYPSARAFPSFLTAAVHALVGLFNPQNRYSRAYRNDDAAAGEVDWVSGACLLVRRDAFFSVGGFDERYFMYVEDLDLCWRLRRAGWSVRYVPGARVVHEQGRSTSRRPIRMLAAHHVSTWRFANKRATGAERLLLPFVALALLARFAAALSRQLGQGKRPAHEAQAAQLDADEVAKRVE